MNDLNYYNEGNVLNFFFCRDKLLGAVTNGFRFDGNGVVVLDRDRFRPSKASMISLKFKTYADNGLMLLVGKDRDFMSLELHDGKVRIIVVSSP